MKHIYLVLFVFVLLGCSFISKFDNCKGNKLSTACAQKGIDVWKVRYGYSGTIKVTGVQIQKSGGATQARAHLQMEQMSFKGNFGQEVFTGKGVADFSHFDDGRWALTRIGFYASDYYQWGGDITVE